MTEFVMLCLEKEQHYKKFSDKIGASCAQASKTPLKVQKQVIDRIKEVIKAKPQKHTAKQKFFALKLLNKVVMKKNTELNDYVEAKIMSRLTILAEFNNNPEEKSAQLLLSRGKNIFGPDEPDHQNSANFLIILLDCIEKWALTFAFEEGEVDDAVSKSTRSKAQQGDKFYRCYTKLLDKGVKFPSTFQGKDRQSQKKKSADQDEGPPQ
jgi:predicted house-cleaning noncanonical NTP pyrophosphatase (MazG superfamily)